MFYITRTTRPKQEVINLYNKVRKDRTFQNDSLVDYQIIFEGIYTTQ